MGSSEIPQFQDSPPARSLEPVETSWDGKFSTTSRPPPPGHRLPPFSGKEPRRQYPGRPPSVLAISPEAGRQPGTRPARFASRHPTSQASQPWRPRNAPPLRPRPGRPLAAPPRPGLLAEVPGRPASPTRARQLPARGPDWPPHSRFPSRTAILKILLIRGSGERGASVTPESGPRASSSAPAAASGASSCPRAPGPRRPAPAVHSMSSSGPAAEGEGTPAQPASEKEPEMPDPREESEEEDEDDEEEEEEEEEEKEKSLIVEGKREKKKVERLTMQVSSLQREPFTIAQGKGQKLCEIERIHFFLSKKKTDELRNLHKLLYNRPGTVSSLKKNVGQFSGFPFEKGSVQYKKKEEMLKKFRNAMLKSICEVLDLERSGVNSELVKRILNFLMHPKPSGKPLPKSKKSSSKGNKKERNSSGMARKAKRTKCPEILSDESSSDEDEKKNKEESSDDEDKESEEEQPPKKTSKREKPKQKATSKSKKTVKSANVKKADSSTTKKNQNSSKKESESEDSSDDEPLIKKLKKPPTDEELKETVKKLLASANLEEVTMKQICKEVYENYPAYDLTERKDFIKTTVKELIS